MTVTIDTSAYSAFRRGHLGIRGLIRQTARLGMSVIVIGELGTGFRRGNRQSQNARDLDSFLASPRVHVIDADAVTADRYAEILNFLVASGSPMPTNDVWIAAQAMQHGLQVVTTDRHFTLIPQVSTLHFDP